jgi:hypothetical protein
MLDGRHFDRLIKYNLSEAFGGLQVRPPLLCDLHMFIVLQGYRRRRLF